MDRRERYEIHERYCLYLGNRWRSELGLVRVVRLEPCIDGLLGRKSGGLHHHLHDYCACGVVVDYFADDDGRCFVASRQTRALMAKQPNGKRRATRRAARFLYSKSYRKNSLFSGSFSYMQSWLLIDFVVFEYGCALREAFHGFHSVFTSRSGLVMFAHAKKLTVSAK